MTNKQPNTRAGEAPAANQAVAHITQLEAQIAKLDAMQAERDKATADLGAIDEIVVLYGWNKPEADIGKKTVAAIAAPYRVETDPLEAEADKLMAMDQSTRVIVLSALKRGLEIGEKNA